MRLIGISLCLLIAGCFGPITLQDYSETRVIEVPGDSEIHTATVGDVMVARRKQTVVRAIKISADTIFGKSEGESTVFYCGLSFKPEVIPLRGSVESMGRTGECYGPARGSNTDGNGLTSTMGCDGTVAQMDICQDIEDDTFFVYYPNHNKAPVIPLEQDFENISTTEMLVPAAGSFLQEIKYVDLSQDSLQFRYREFSDESELPDFEQDLQIPLTETPMKLIIRGVELDITSTSDTEIEYRLVSGGPN